MEIGDVQAGVSAYAQSLPERLTRVKVAKPVGLGHSEAWRQLTAIAEDAAIQSVI